MYAEGQCMTQNKRQRKGKKNKGTGHRVYDSVTPPSAKH